MKAKLKQRPVFIARANLEYELVRLKKQREQLAKIIKSAYRVIAHKRWDAKSGDKKASAWLDGRNAFDFENGTYGSKRKAPKVPVVAGKRRGKKAGAK